MRTGFPLRRLDELALSVDYGVTASASIAKVGPQFLRITDIQDDRVDWATVPFCEASAAEEEGARLEGGDIVFARTGATTGKSFLIRVCPERAVFASYLIRVRPNLREVEPRYLAWYFQTPHYWRQITSSASGTAQPGVNATKLKALSVPRPPLAEQRRIADILDKADAIRRKRKETIALTEELLRSAFLDMFGDPVTNPKGWPVKALRELLATDPRIGTLVPASDNPGTLVVRVGELGAYDVELSRSKRAALSDAEFERYGLETGDVLLARAIGSEDHLGKASVLQPHDQRVAFDSHVMRLRFRDDVLDPYVFVQWLRTPGGRARFMNEAGRTAVQFNVNGKQIVKVKIPLPPRSEQRRFRGLFDSVRAMGGRSDVARCEADTLFNSLVARAFSGGLSS